MNANEVGQIVDKLAEKMGVAVEKIQPLAEEIVRQYQARALAQVVICGLIACALCVVGAALLRKGNAYQEKHGGDNGAFDLFVAATASFVVACVPVGSAIASVMHYIAPLPSILGL